MKQRLLAAFAGIVLAFGIVGFIDASAQTIPTDSVKKDSIVVKASPDAVPIFSGKETNKTDSLFSVIDALQDTTLKHLITGTVAEIQKKPGEGATVSAWIGWGVAVFASVIAVITYIRKRLQAKPAAK